MRLAERWGEGQGTGNARPHTSQTRRNQSYPIPAGHAETRPTPDQPDTQEPGLPQTSQGIGNS